MRPDPPPPDLVPTVPEPIEHATDSDRLSELDTGLRETTARGTIINAVFLVGVQTLNLLKGFVVVVFVTTQEYGVWGLLAVSLGTLGWLKNVGIGDKYVQQDEEDQERAFQKAFTLELIVDLVMFGLIIAALPLFALLYGQSEIIGPGMVMAAAVPAVALQAPLWIHYRRMRFARQRALQSVDPIIAFVVTIALAAAGAGYWSLVIGLVVGAWAAAIAAVLASPYRLALRYDRGTLREYAGFSWPLFVAGLSGILASQLTMIVGSAEVGLAGIGAITLAGSIALYAEKTDGLITETLYPAICAVRDRTELLLESFVKSNRLAMMGGVPLGIGVALFASDLVHFVIGERWVIAIGLIQAYGLIAAINQIGFNWSAFFRAQGDTRPIGVMSVVGFGVFAAVALPLLVTEGLDGLAIGMAAAAAVVLIGRTLYLRSMFGRGFSIITQTVRGLGPSVPAVAIVVAARAVEGGERTGAMAAVELALYLLVTLAATWVLERALLREAFGYLRKARA